MDTSELVYSWNLPVGAPPAIRGPVAVLDESLRDGLQSPSVHNPSIEEKIEILHLMEALGINYVNLGLPCAGPRAYEHCLALAQEIARSRMRIRPNLSGRTHEADIRPMVEIVQKVGIPMDAAIFIGSSPIRKYVEDWTDDFLVSTTEKAVKFAVSQGLSVMYVTEDTTRCDPATVKRLYSTAIANGARAIVVCDTCGYATPDAVTKLIRFVRDEVVKPSGEEIRIDWHGHCDRGLAVTNALIALEVGANCAHGCALGIGERSGNTQLDQLLVNLKLLNVEPWNKQDLSRLKEYCGAVSRYTGVPIPQNYPVLGEDAFRTGTGVHAAAVIKALRKHDIDLADAVYSGVPAHLFGLSQVIEIGPMSGKSNVSFWLEQHGLPITDAAVDSVFQFAKTSDRVLSADEILACYRKAQS